MPTDNITIQLTGSISDYANITSAELDWKPSTNQFPIINATIDNDRTFSLEYEIPSPSYSGEIQISGANLLDNLSIPILYPVATGTEICGDGRCAVNETKLSCPRDCCLTTPNRRCEWPLECAEHDPDCCVNNECYDQRFTCENNEKGDDCYPGRCDSGSCTTACSSYDDCYSGFCSGGTCSNQCVENYNPAPDFESCCECWSGGICQPCHSLGVKGNGFIVHKGRRISVPIQLYNASQTLQDINITISGPLRDYVIIDSDDVSWTGNGFTYIGQNAIKEFYLTLDEIPNELTGVHQIKLSISYDSGSTSYLVWGAVLPVNFVEQGREPPPKGNVGVSREVRKMSYENTYLPVEVILSVW